MNEDQIKQYALHEADQIINRIAEIRKKKQLSQEQLAEKAGISRNGIGKAERGEVKISIVTFCAILKALDTPYSEFFDGLENTSEITYTKSDQILDLVNQIVQHPNRDKYIEVMQVLLKETKVKKQINE